MALCCCWEPRLIEDNRPKTHVVDVEAAVADHVWRKFLGGVEWRMKRAWLARHRGDYIIEVPRNYIHMEQYKKPKLTHRELHKTKKKPQNHPQNYHSNTTEIVTDYVNDTETEQTYKFRLEKTRTAQLNVNVQKGWTFGGKTQLTLGLPAVSGGSKAGAGFDMKFTVSKTQSEQLVETETFETTSDITVKEGQAYVAKVLLKEREVSYDFKAWTKLSLPAGSVPVSIRHRRSGRLAAPVYMLTRLDEAFQGYDKELVHIKEDRSNGYSDPLFPEEADMVTYTVIIESSGIIEGSRLSDQEINLSAKPIRPEDDAGSHDDDDCLHSDHDDDGDLKKSSRLEMNNLTIIDQTEENGHVDFKDENEKQYLLDKERASYVTKRQCERSQSMPAPNSYVSSKMKTTTVV